MIRRRATGVVAKVRGAHQVRVGGTVAGATGRFARECLIQAFDGRDHPQGGLASMRGVMRVVQRRVPKRHQAVTDILVDGATLCQHGLGHRRQDAVDQGRQTLGIVLEAFRDGGKAAYVAEHDGHGALVAAELQLLRVLGEPLDDHGGQVAAEGAADLAALCLRGEIGDHRVRQEDEHHHRRWHERIDHPALGIEGVPRAPDGGRDRQTTDDRTPDRAGHRQENDQ